RRIQQLTITKADIMESVGNGKSRSKMVQLMRRWQKIARAAVRRSNNVPADVPEGHMAVYASSSGDSSLTLERFIIRAVYVNHPLFVALLEKGEQEFSGARNGPILIPCNPLIFSNQILPLLTRNAQLTAWEIEQVLSYCYTCTSSSSCVITETSQLRQMASSHAITCS
ncbi:hypothetical protein KI387_010246, partial [Taxus chinensis]